MNPLPMEIDRLGGLGFHNESDEADDGAQACSASGIGFDWAIVPTLVPGARAECRGGVLASVSDSMVS